MSSTRYSYRILVKLDFPAKILEMYSNIKFLENLSSGNQVVPCGQADSQTDTTKLIVVFRNFGNAPYYIQQFSSYITENTSSTLHTPISIVLGISECLLCESYATQM